MDLFELLPTRLVTFSEEDTYRLQSSNPLECPICLDDNTHTSFIRIKDCSHFFCLDCFKEHLLTKIQARKVLKIICPQDNCSHILPAKLLEKILDPSVFEKYTEIVLQKANARVSGNNFCPKPGCSKPYTKAKNTPHTTCSCGTIICNKCGRESHEGKDCIDALDGSFEAFIQENNLKFCIMCKTVVDKMEGCLHITCPVCDYEWCWLCGNEFSENHGLKCSGKWNPMPPGKIVRESEPSSWRKTVKTIFLVILYLVLFPIKLLLWPCFNLNIYGELRNPHRTTEERMKVVVFFLLINLLHGGIIAIYTWLAYNLVSNYLGLVIIIGIILIIIFMVQIYYVTKRSTPIGRWESRNSSVFRFGRSARVHVGDHVERREIVLNPQQAPQSGDGEDLEALRTSATPLASDEVPKFITPPVTPSHNQAEMLIVPIDD